MERAHIIRKEWDDALNHLLFNNQIGNDVCIHTAWLKIFIHTYLTLNFCPFDISKKMAKIFNNELNFGKLITLGFKCLGCNSIGLVIYGISLMTPCMGRWNVILLIRYHGNVNTDRFPCTPVKNRNLQNIVEAEGINYGLLIKTQPTHFHHLTFEFSVQVLENFKILMHLFLKRFNVVNMFQNNQKHLKL